MAQITCEASLRPDWLSTSFKSATEHHREHVWSLAQAISRRTETSEGWAELSPSRHFDYVLAHPSGMRFESSGRDSQKNPGISLLTMSGVWFATTRTVDQMRALEEIYDFPGKYHFTRLDCQVTTLNPSMTAEGICDEVRAGNLWIKGYKGWEPRGEKDKDGRPTSGLSAYFGSPTSDRQCKSYNKAKEQGWETEARRDEQMLRAKWAEEHTNLIIRGIAGASSENEAISAYTKNVSAVLAQHMQYLDLSGQPKPLPKNWARNAKVPKWWNDTLDQEFQPVTLTRKVTDDLDEKMIHCRKQWARIIAAYMAKRVRDGRSESFMQSTIDTAMEFLCHLKLEDAQEIAEGLPEKEKAYFMECCRRTAELGATHSEWT